MRWKPKRAVNTESMKPLEAETKSAEMIVESHALQRREDVKESVEPKIIDMIREECYA